MLRKCDTLHTQTHNALLVHLTAMMNPVSAARGIGSKRLIRMILRLTLSDRVIKLTSPSAIVQDIAMSGHGGLSFSKLGLC